jgi:hypothetical protein
MPLLHRVPCLQPLSAPKRASPSYEATPSSFPNPELCHRPLAHASAAKSPPPEPPQVPPCAPPPLAMDGPSAAPTGSASMRSPSLTTPAPPATTGPHPHRWLHPAEPHHWGQLWVSPRRSPPTSNGSLVTTSCPSHRSPPPSPSAGRTAATAHLWPGSLAI